MPRDPEDLFLHKTGFSIDKMGHVACLLGPAAACEQPIIELGHGWMATVKAEGYNAGGTAVITKYFYAYEGASRQAAIDRAIADYRKYGGGLAIQKLRVGLVSEIPYAALAAYYGANGWPDGDDRPSEINYRSMCDWTMYGPQFNGKRGTIHDEYGRNRHPDIFSGVMDTDPTCRNQYRTDEKLPPPVLGAGR